MNIDSSIIAALVGAFFGIIGSLVVAHYKLRGRRDYFDEKAIKLLERRLDKYKEGRSTTELCEIGKAIGLSQEDTKQLLFLSKAKMKDDKGTSWTLHD